MYPNSTLSSRRRRSGGIAVLVFALCILDHPAGATAQGSGASGGVDGDLRLGVYTEASEAFVGGGILARLGPTKWFMNPNLEYVFVDRGDLATINFDFQYDLTSNAEVDFWFGAGAALVLRENHRGSSETDFGVNLFGGVGFLRQASVRPYFQAKLLLSDDSEGVIAFGIRFF